MCRAPAAADPRERHIEVVSPLLGIRGVLRLVLRTQPRCSADSVDAPYAGRIEHTIFEYCGVIRHGALEPSNAIKRY